MEKCGLMPNILHNIPFPWKFHLTNNPDRGSGLKGHFTSTIFPPAREPGETSSTASAVMR